MTPNSGKDARDARTSLSSRTTITRCACAPDFCTTRQNILPYRMRESGQHNKRNLKTTVVTGTIPIAQVINKSDNATVIMLGGVLTKGEEISSGLLCEEYLKIFHTHKAIIGVASITESNGVTDYDMQMTIIKRKMIDRSDTSIFVADHSKFNKSVVYTVAELDEVDVLVTDSKTDPKDIEMCRNHDINVIIADV